MKTLFSLIFLSLSEIAFGQRIFDSLMVKESLMKLPCPKHTRSLSNIVFRTIEKDFIKALETVDKNFRVIADSLFNYKSLSHTILQTVLIETNGGLKIDPLKLGDKLHLANIIFENESMNVKVKSFANYLNQIEKEKLYKFLYQEFDNFWTKTYTLEAQAVRIIYVKFPDDRFIQIGIDIYGSHFLWKVDREKNWEIIEVKMLWVY